VCPLPSIVFQALENSPTGVKLQRDYQPGSRQFTLEHFENDHMSAFNLGWAITPKTLSGSHLGMGFNPPVWRIIARTLGGKPFR
jgi:hypothetical protein